MVKKVNMTAVQSTMIHRIRSIVCAMIRPSLTFCILLGKNTLPEFNAISSPKSFAYELSSWMLTMVKAGLV